MVFINVSSETSSLVVQFMNSGTSANTYAHVDTLYTHISGRGKEKLGEGKGGREREREKLSVLQDDNRLTPWYLCGIGLPGYFTEPKIERPLKPLA